MNDKMHILFNVMCANTIENLTRFGGFRVQEIAFLMHTFVTHKNQNASRFFLLLKNAIVWLFGH